MSEEIEEDQCSDCGQWTNIEDLEEFGDDIELYYLCPLCYYRATSQPDPLEFSYE